jgi:hypothetical protein
MKKFFTLLCCAPVLLVAQSTQRVDISANKEANALKVAEVQSPVVNKLKSAPLRKTNGSDPVYGAKNIGNTLYDLQSNSSVARRLMLYSGGKMTAVWTTSSDGGSAYSQRGTGYNQFVSNDWRKTLPNNTRFENSRVGWPNIGVATFNGTEKEYVFAHAVATSGLTGGFNFSKNTGIGTDFVDGSVVLNDASYNTATTPGPIWGRTATAGTRIILISCFADSSANYPVNARLSGVKRPNTYSVFNAATETWITKNQTLPGYDSVRYDLGQADAYAIDANGNNVSIVMGGLFDDLAIWTSTDAGSSWTKTILDSFNTALPTPRTSPKVMNNGAVSILVDNNGITHVAYAILGAAWDSVSATDTANYVFFGPEREGIAYWNNKINTSTGKPDPAILIGYTIDQDQDNVITLAANSRNRAYGGYGSSISFSNGTSYTALSNQPMLTVDPNGNILCTYIAPVEGQESPDQENYSDIYVVYSKDNGKTWGDPQNLTKTDGYDDIFPSIPSISDTKLRVAYFLKEDPGISVNTPNNPESNVPVNYMEIPIIKILNDSVGIYPAGINNSVVDPGFNVAQNYPNPFHGVTQIDFTITTNADVTFSVTDILGKVLYTETNNNTEAGKHSLYFNSGELSKGVYFYTVNIGTQKITQKMIVE